MSDHGTIGFGILGCGRVVERRVGPAFANCRHARIEAFCSRDADKARRFAETFHAGRGCGRLDEMLADPRVTAVYVATPNHLHQEHAVACLSAGKHVLLDKPMALNARQAEEMAVAARRSDRTLGLLHQQRFHPANQRLFDLLRAGTLGRPLFIHMQTGFWYDHGDNWRLHMAQSGGGPAMDLGPHALDILLAAAGPVRNISARTFNLHFKHDVEDFCTARLETESGAVAQLEFAYCTHQYGGRMEVYGAEGSYVTDGSLQQAASYRQWLRVGQHESPIEERETPDCYAMILDDFAEALREGRPPAVTMQDGVAVTRVLDAVYASARQGGASVSLEN